MEKKRQEIDIVNEILEHCLLSYHHSTFVMSLYQQYQQRGSLSKKQLQGLLAKAEQLKDLPPGKLATLQAVINKMATRFKSELPPATPVYKTEEDHLQIIHDILAKYPQHKRVLFLRSKLENHEALQPAEVTDLKRLQQLLSKKGQEAAGS